MKETIALALGLLPLLSHAGYEMPSYVDGCRSMGGRFEITARQTVKGKSSHGSNKWNYLWKDLKTGKTAEFPARSVQGGSDRWSGRPAPLHAWSE